MTCFRRSHGTATTTSLPRSSSSSTLTGFVRLEDHATPSSPSTLHSPRRKRCGSTGSNSSSTSGSSSSTSSSGTSKERGARWLYAVLAHGELKCYARRADAKLSHAAPVYEVALNLLPSPSHPTPFAFDQQALYVRCRHTGTPMAIRLHENAKLKQWVTRLYYQTLEAAAATRKPAHGEDRDELRHAAAPRKRVSFVETPQVTVLPQRDANVDKTELFYGKEDYAAFLRLWKQEDALYPKSGSLLRLCEKCKY